MAFVQKLRLEVQKNRKVGFVQRLRYKVYQNRKEEREVAEYIECMDVYKKIVECPFNYTFDSILNAEDVLDAMIVAAVADQRKHRKYAKDALEQMQNLQQ
jgi:hypothetical protein